MAGSMASMIGGAMPYAAKALPYISTAAPYIGNLVSGAGRLFGLGQTGQNITSAIGTAGEGIGKAARTASGLISSGQQMYGGASSMLDSAKQSFLATKDAFGRGDYAGGLMGISSGISSMVPQGQRLMSQAQSAYGQGQQLVSDLGGIFAPSSGQAQAPVQQMQPQQVPVAQPQAQVIPQQVQPQQAQRTRRRATVRR